MTSRQQQLDLWAVHSPRWLPSQSQKWLWPSRRFHYIPRQGMSLCPIWDEFVSVKPLVLNKMQNGLS